MKDYINIIMQIYIYTDELPKRHFRFLTGVTSDRRFDV